MPHKRKSRTFRRVYIKTPGGKTKISYRKREPSKARCAICGSILHGVARGRKNKIKKLSKTQKRPERPYAGVFCSRCVKEKIIQKARTIKLK